MFRNPIPRSSRVPSIYRTVKEAHFSNSRYVCESGGQQPAKDWNAIQYLKFNNERTRPSHDLLAQIPLASPTRIVDLGCGPGNSTQVLAERYPQSKVSGIDSSPDMIAAARKLLPTLEFAIEDLTAYRPTESVDLFFCNAVLHWLSTSERIKLITNLLQSQSSGSVFAFQVPDNLAEPSHELMRTTASDGPWAKILERHLAARDEFQTSQQLYDHISPYCTNVNIWRTSYQHVLNDHKAIVEWVKSTGLRPYIDPLPKEERESYLAAYLRKLEEAYPVSQDGKVLFPFPRLFVVATRR